ncbi:MAG: TIR domain-containing protein [Phycisphaerales bacterium]|nr:TIR domain-containing protein [Hyphomonadaceae bacterium]
MADIFISYKREDRQVAERLSIAIEQLGFDVWWDFDLLSGERYRKVIRQVIDQCGVAIVLWSERAVESDFVMDEASHAKSQGKLCPARIDGVALPFGFGSVHTDDLVGWDGELSHPGFQALVRALESRLGRKGRLGAARAPEAQAASAELDAFKVRHGFGVMHMRSGARYNGAYREGDRSGGGVYYFVSGRRYEGEWASGDQNGYGVLWDAEGRVSQAGIWSNDRLTTPLSR